VTVRLDKRPSDSEVLREIANSSHVQDEVLKLAKDIQRDARRLAPKESGRLRRGIAVEEITDLETGIEGYAVGWSDKAFYGQLVEEGTENNPPRPHLVPAAIKNGAGSAVRGGQA
jgi:HK97 gp10 family phage protein